MRAPASLKFPACFAILYLIILAPMSVQGEEIDARLTTRRAYNFLVVNDPISALDVLQKALKAQPASKLLHEARIEVLADIGDETRLLDAWTIYTQLFPEEAQNRALIETMAWGIIDKGTRSPAPPTRAIGLLAAHAGNDARGVSMLAQSLNSSNALIRGLAVGLVSEMRDSRLQDEMLRLLKQEKDWAVRLEVIRGIGKMKVYEARPTLENIVANDRSTAEEKAAAIESLVYLMETVDRPKIEALARSNRAGLRLLACEVVAFCGTSEDITPLVPLLQDTCPEVRACALQVSGAFCTRDMRNGNLCQVAQRMVNENDPLVSISAAWFLMSVDPKLSQQVFQRWLRDPLRSNRILAAGALASTGGYGADVSQKALEESSDPFVKMNLAMGLLRQRKNVPNACHTLAHCLKSSSERWMWKQQGLFRFIAPSEERHKEEVANYPEAVNQMVRLEVLNALAILKYPKTENAIREFLQEHTWGISGAAASLLISEGDEEALDLVRDLLKDKDKNVRIQAALVLALWGNDPSAATILEEAYPQADSILRAKLLEALGSIGNEKSISFLVERLKEPYQHLRLIAATALIQCLNH